MDYNAEKIFKILKTKERANEFLVFSDVLQSFDYYVEDIDFMTVLKEKFGNRLPGWLEELLDNLPSENGQHHKEKLLELVKNVQEIIKGSEIVKIEMSFEPSEDFIDQAIKLLKGKFVDSNKKGKNILLDIDLKEIGEPGALVYLDGKFLDLTLKNQVINYLMSEDVINRYL